MPRMIAALVVGLSLAALSGCSSAQNIPPDPPEPPQSAVVAVDRDDDPVLTADRGDQETRQRALRVMAIEQRSLLDALESERRFVRVAFGTSERMREALIETHRELRSVERGIATLEAEDGLSASQRLDRQDELKTRLRRVATRLGLLENAIRAK